MTSIALADASHVPADPRSDIRQGVIVAALFFIVFLGWATFVRLDAAAYADPVPQALVLTAIVISFATTALFLVVLIASRGFTGTDHVDGKDDDA